MSGQPGLIERGWLFFAEQALPANVSDIQKWEMKKAFFAGAGLLFQNMTNAVGSDDVSEDDGVDIMQSVDDELHAFFEGVKRGRR